MTTGAFTTFSIAAANLPEHARNPIHTDDGAQAAGFPRALVAGVTTYAYLTHPLAVGWGLGWLGHGTAEVRFRSPVFDRDRLDCVPTIEATNTDGGADRVRVEGRVAPDQRPRVVVTASCDPGEPSPLRVGEPLRDRTIRLDGELGSEYGARAGDLLEIYGEQGIVHPAVWPAIANVVVHADVARGSWIHTRSVVRHHALAPVGGVALVRSVVVDRFQAHGERAVLDVAVEVDGVVVATLEHEAIVALPR